MSGNGRPLLGKRLRRPSGRSPGSAEGRLMKEKAIVLWSGGKDSALALYDIQGDYEIIAVCTTVTEGYDRISMHGVRTSLLDLQAKLLGYPLEKILIPPVCSNEEYERRMRLALQKYRELGAKWAICGDIFLEDVRRYRE